MLFFLMLSPFLLKAQEAELNLEQAIEIALNNNSGLRSSQLKVDQSDELIGTAFDLEKTQAVVETIAEKEQAAAAEKLALLQDIQARVADELAMLNETVRLLGQENDRIGRALRDWQIMHAHKHKRTHSLYSSFSFSLHRSLVL